MYGSPSHKPLSSMELVAWAGYDRIVAWETERARQRAKAAAKSR